MKKLLFCFSMLISGSIMAQQHTATGSELSIGLDGGLPVGDFNKAYKFGIGGTVKYAYNFDESIAVTLQSGFISFQGKKDVAYTFETENQTITIGADKIPALRQIPLKAGVRFFLGSVYFEPQLGVSFFSSSGESTSAFTYAGNIGIFASENFDISARYEGFSKNSQSNGFIGLRLAYNFPL